jgi:hypothetical protein
MRNAISKLTPWLSRNSGRPNTLMIAMRGRADQQSAVMEPGPPARSHALEMDVDILVRPAAGFSSHPLQQPTAVAFCRRPQREKSNRHPPRRAAAEPR